MDQNIGRTDLLPTTVPTLVLLLMAVAGLTIWVVAHTLLRRRNESFSSLRRFAILAPIGSVASWCLLQWAARLLFLSGNWSLWMAAIVIGFSIVGVSLLYERECEVVRPRLARMLVLMRLLAIGVTIFILLQPVWVTTRGRAIRRRVAVLVDESASMHRPETQWMLGEMLDVAQALGPVKPEQRPLRTSHKSCQELRQNLANWRQLVTAVDKLANPGELADYVKDSSEWADAQIAALNTSLEGAVGDRYAEERDQLDRVVRQLRDALRPALEKIGQLLEAGSDSRPLQAPLATMSDALDQLLATLPDASAAADKVLWDGFAPEVQESVRELSGQPRFTLAQNILDDAGKNTSPELLTRLRSRYDIDLFTFARETQRIADPAAFFAIESQYDNVASGLTDGGATNVVEGAEAADGAQIAFRAVTDITRSIEEVMSAVPSEELAGVLLMTDGRHTGEAGVEAVARRLGQARVPVSTIVIGGTRPPVDIALADARAPESVFLGDRVRVVATVAATGARGQKSRLRLKLGDEVIAEQELEIDSNDWRREVRLTDMPENQGVRRYRLEVDPIEGELLEENNSWSLDVSISDDRTNVLLVDNHPRWEFRYLRNLFYGRDKSVHLQYYLVSPDVIEGHEAAPLPAASASRKFGDAEAGDLPVGRDEWRKFDVIILGDLDEETLTPAVVEDIRYCVEERGALLVVIGGPESMPHRIQNASLRSLLPIRYDPIARDFRRPPEEAFRLVLTPAGRAHDTMRQSASASENEQIWSELPDLRWRLPLAGVKPGAEVLAYARSTAVEEDRAAQHVISEMGDNPEEAVRRLAELREQQARNALVVAQTAGQGKALFLATDRTWRMRYRIGDTVHHRFWGQVMRWGTGEKLRTGNEYVRLGTDQLTYTPDEPVRVMARMADKTFAPLSGARSEVIIMRDDRELKRVELQYRKDSNGIYEGTIDSLAEAGAYSLMLRSPDARARLGDAFPDQLQTSFVVVTARRPAEFVDLTADWKTPQTMAQLSGGEAVSPADARLLWDSFGEGSRILQERLERPLWDSWYLFVLIVLLVTIEWLLRKRGGLV